MIPTTSERVPLNTSDAVNRQIREETCHRISQMRQASPMEIHRRIAELEQEWDIERTLEANAATACLIGVTLGATVDRRWFYFPAVIGGFLLQHAIQGWCPPVPVFRRLGVRTQREIDEELFALKTLRGDFRRLGNADEISPESLMAAVEQ